MDVENKESTADVLWRLCVRRRLSNHELSVSSREMILKKNCWLVLESLVRMRL